MTELPSTETRLAALESDLAEQKQANAELRQRVADLEAFKAKVLDEKRQKTERINSRELTVARLQSLSDHLNS
ncbi:hypothetical protein [Labrenzia sp. DG1229]|uniref:hypothetical protein n=1 Tax=Labrenzia sp. DG1229 TaxID=681847 RepID=UPI00048C6774|nr:hypothetical protein [Labrenzia sp. DG1229]